MGTVGERTGWELGVGTGAGPRVSGSIAPFPLLDADLARELVSEAALAPSVHNVQPARWTTAPGDVLVLLRAVDRALPAADPSGHDVRISLGAALEGASLAASGRGDRKSVV